MKKTAASLVLLLALLSHAEDAPVHAWQFNSANADKTVVKALAGPYAGTIVGPHEFQSENPPCLKLTGDKTRIELPADPKTAILPRQDITCEAWVAIDKVQEWGGIIGAMQDNGLYERGFLLGYKHDHFFFAVSTKGKMRLTYLEAAQAFLPGSWYHVVGTYDGKLLRVYVDGHLQATSKEQSGAIEYSPKYFYTIAAYRDDDEFYPMAGRIESVALFDRALSAEQIAARFNAHKSIFPGIDPVRPVVADWPTDMRDNQRTGVTDQALAFPLNLTWQYTAQFAPRPAWPEEAKQDYYHRRTPRERVNFDKAFHVVGVQDRIYFSSSADDRVRCLDAATAAERWSFCTEGPVRLAPTLDNGRAYFGSDDGFAYCVDALTGKLAWKTRVAPSDRRIAGNERIISAWPVRTDVFIENGSAHVCAGIFAEQGVSQAMLDCRDGSILLNRPIATTAQGYQRRLFGKLQIGTGRNLAGAFVAQLANEGKEAGPESAQLPEPFSYSVIGTNAKNGAAGVYINGGENKITAYDAKTNEQLWSAPVEGRAWSLAVVGGRLYASTDKGRIYCFSSDAGNSKKIEPPPLTTPTFATHAQAIKDADFMLTHAPDEKGYCLVCSHGATDLVCELARRTQWRFVVRISNDTELPAARRIFESAGLADRVAFHQGTTAHLPYTDYLFNTIVCADLLEGKSFDGPRDEIRRVLRPGGVAFFGMDDKGIERRGPIAGAGEWTHQYADPGNSACSGDDLVKGNLQIQWFGPPGPLNMIDRHHRTAAPLSKDGRLFIPGEDHIAAVDAYNGTILWERDVPDTKRVIVFRDSSYLALNSSALFAASRSACLKFDPQTGKTLHEFALPGFGDGVKREWDYVALSGDLLIGSATKAGTIRRVQAHILTTTETHWDFVPIIGCDQLFAFKQSGGETAWTYKSERGLIVTPTICIGNGAIYFIESNSLTTLEWTQSRVRLAEMFKEGGTLKALDLKTGKRLWSKPIDGIEKTQHNIYASYSNDVVALVGTRNSGTDKKLSRVIFDIRVLDAKDGALKWSEEQTQATAIGGEHGEQDLHPAIVNGTLYCEPHAYDLLTGKPADWKWPWMTKSRRGCGTLSASNACLFFRDETMKQFDLKSNLAEEITTDTRPGCWINLIPAGGLLLAPEASSGCTCNHAVQTSMGLIPKP